MACHSSRPATWTRGLRPLRRSANSAMRSLPDTAAGIASDQGLWQTPPADDTMVVEADMSTVVRWFVVIVLTVHGLIHLMGAAKGLGWAQVDQLREPVGVLAGVGWLVAGVLVVTAAAMIAAGAPTSWWAVALVAAVVSQAMVMSSWSDAKAGTLANALLVLAAVLGFAALGPSSYHAEWDRRTGQVLQSAPAPAGVLAESDLAGLPAPVARYIRRTGALGKPKVVTLSAEMRGRIRGGPSENWMPFRAQQISTFGALPQRLFYLDARRAGLPVTVFHVFDDSGATMRGKVLSLVPILDASGPQMDRGETVTIFNDLVVLAPAAIPDAVIAWELLDTRHVKGTFTRGDQTVSAQLVFDDDGDLVDFVSEDRLRASGDGKSFTRMLWNTPVGQYRDMGGRRVASSGSAAWAAPSPEGHFTYVEMTTERITYNVHTSSDRNPELSSAQR